MHRDLGVAGSLEGASLQRSCVARNAHAGGGVPEPEGRRVNEELKSTTDYASRLQEQVRGRARVP